jgi:hypothetical protein
LYTTRELGVGTDDVGWPGQHELTWGVPAAGTSVWFVVDIDDDCGSAAVAGSFNAWEPTQMVQDVFRPTVFRLPVAVEAHMGMEYSFVKCPGTAEEDWEWGAFDDVTTNCAVDDEFTRCYNGGLLSTTLYADNSNLQTLQTSTARFLYVGDAHIGWRGSRPLPFRVAPPTVPVWFSVDLGEQACDAAGVLGTFSDWNAVPMTRVDDTSVFSVKIDVQEFMPIYYVFMKCGTPESMDWEHFEEITTGCTAGNQCYADGLVSSTQGGTVLTSRYQATGVDSIGWPGMRGTPYGEPAPALTVWFAVDIMEDCDAAWLIGSFNAWQPMEMQRREGTNVFTAQIEVTPRTTIQYRFIKCAMPNPTDPNGMQNIEQFDAVDTDCHVRPLTTACLADGLVSITEAGQTSTHRYVAAASDDIGWPGMPARQFGVPSESVRVYFNVDVGSDCQSVFVLGSFNGFTRTPMVRKFDSDGNPTNVFQLAVFAEPMQLLEYTFVTSECGDEAPMHWERLREATTGCSYDATADVKRCYENGVISKTQADETTRSHRFLKVETEHIGWSGSAATVWNTLEEPVEAYFSVDTTGAEDVDSSCGVMLTGSFSDWNMIPMDPMGEGKYTLKLLLQAGIPVHYKFAACDGAGGYVWEQFESVLESCDIGAMSHGMCISDSLVSIGMPGQPPITGRYMGVTYEHMGWSGQRFVPFNELVSPVSVWFVVDVGPDACGADGQTKTAFVAGSFNGMERVEMQHRPVVSGRTWSDTEFQLEVHVARNQPVHYRFIRCEDPHEWENFDPVDVDCIGSNCYNDGLVSRTSSSGQTTTDRFLAVGTDDIGWSGARPLAFGVPSPGVSVWLHVDIKDTCPSGAAVIGSFNDWQAVSMMQREEGGTIYSIKLLIEASNVIEYLFIKCPEDGNTGFEDFPEVTTTCSGDTMRRCYSNGLLSTTIDRGTNTARFIGVGVEHVGWQGGTPEAFNALDPPVSIYFKVDTQADCEGMVVLYAAFFSPALSSFSVYVGALRCRLAGRCTCGR